MYQRPQTSSLGSLVNDGRAMLLIHPHELFIPSNSIEFADLIFTYLAMVYAMHLTLKCVNKKEAKGMSERVLEAKRLACFFDITAGKCKQLEA